MSEAKHAAAYGFGGKDGAAADLSTRTLHDVYLRPWRELMQAGGRGAMLSHSTEGGGMLVHSKRMLVHSKGMLVHSRGMLVHSRGMLVHCKGMVVHSSSTEGDVGARYGGGMLVQSRGMLVHSTEGCV